MATLKGTAGKDKLTGTSSSDSIDGLEGDDVIDGLGGNDSLYGGQNNDIMYGGDGNDTMEGDWYVYDGDPGYPLGKDAMYGGAGDDHMEGYMGDDILYGGSGNDTIYGDVFGFVYWGYSDVLYGEAGNDELFGYDGNDTLYGGAGDDRMDSTWYDTYGSNGADKLVGGLGNDTYAIDSTGDVVVELAGEGTDTVNSWVSFTLSANVENLLFYGWDDVTYGFGNVLANTISASSDPYNRDAPFVLSGLGGNDILIGSINSDALYGGVGNDILKGWSGADTMDGGAGNDIFYVENAGDKVIELGGQGTDSVNSTVTHTLATNVENLTLTGRAAINGDGNASNNVITGNGAANALAGKDGNDTINGGAGNDRIFGGNGTDTLTGGAGNDTFFFGAAVTSPNFAGDLIKDFNFGNDTLSLDITGTGAFIGAAKFHAGGTIEARYDADLDMVQVDLNNNGLFGSGDLAIKGIAVAPTTSDFLFV